MAASPTKAEMNQDLQAIHDSIFSLQNEIEEIKLSYRELHTNHANTLSSLKTVTQHASDAAQRSAKAAEFAAKAAQNCAEIAKQAATNEIVSAAEEAPRGSFGTDLR